ncbi:MAG: hypothetical protein ACU841_17225 [Gammaproteobacteria bacterium]
MRKSTLNSFHIKSQYLIAYVLSLSTLCLLVTWGIELLAKAFVRMG